MESIEPILSMLANAKAIAGIGGMVGVGQILGFVPRIGLVRAIKLKYDSKLFGVSRPKSVRIDEMKELSNKINSLKKGQYITVIGGKGNGKSCLIDTALEHTPGVVKTSVRMILDDSRVL
jgi:ABC-type antimicrobial peptide transport system ATPase subunit